MIFIKLDKDVILYTKCCNYNVVLYKIIVIMLIYARMMIFNRLLMIL